MIIEYMIIRGAMFSYDNIIYLMSLDQFKNNKTLMHPTRTGIFVACVFSIEQKELNKLYKEIKKHTGAEFIDSRFYKK